MLYWHYCLWCINEVSGGVQEMHAVADALHKRALHPAHPNVLSALNKAAWRVPQAPSLLHPEHDSAAVDSSMRRLINNIDSSRPIVIDIGCGFGSWARSMALQRGDIIGNLLAAVSGSIDNSENRQQVGSVSHNVLGIDLHPASILYARGTAARDQLHRRYSS